MVRRAWNIAKQPPAEKRAALRSYPGSKGGGIEETSHSPWIAIAVFYNRRGEGRYNAGGGEGATASKQGQQIIMGGG